MFCLPLFYEHSRNSVQKRKQRFNNLVISRLSYNLSSNKPLPILSYPILSYCYPIVSYPILSYRILSYRILSYILSYPILSYPNPILSYRIVSYSIVSYPILSYSIRSSLPQFHRTSLKNLNQLALELALVLAYLQWPSCPSTILTYPIVKLKLALAR